MPGLDLTTCLLGADHITPAVSGRVTAHRLPADREAYLADANRMWGIRAGCPAGVRCAVVGTLREIRCHYRINQHCRSFGGVDLLRDGVVVGHAFRDQVQYGDEVCFTLAVADDGLPHRWELWLPVTLSGPFAIDVDGEVMPAPAESKRLLCVGDSITQGMVACGPAGTYAALLARGLGFDLRNHAIGGHIFDAKLVHSTGDWKPDLITIAYGTNDWSMGADAERMYATAAEVLAALRNKHGNTPIALITPLWRENEYTPHQSTGQTLREALARIPELADANTSVIDGADLLPHHRRFTTDGLHPNDLGMVHVADGLLPQLRELLENSG